MALPRTAAAALDGVMESATRQVIPEAEKNTFTVARNAAYALSGYAANVDADTVPARFRLFLHGKEGGYVIAGTTGLERPGVVKFFGKPGLAKAGYRIDAGFARVAPGTYDVYVVKDAEGEMTPTHKKVVVD